MISITDAGLEKMSFEENLEYWYALIRAEKGPDVDLDPEGPWGQIAAILAKFSTDNDDQQEEIYLSRDPDNSTGIAQDKLSSETGTYRREATKTIVENVLLLGDEGAVIEANVSETAQDPKYEADPELTFVLNETVIISRSNARQVLYDLDDPETGTVYTLVINSVNYEYIAIVTDVKSDIIAELIDILPDEVEGSNNGEDQLNIFGDDIDFTIDSSATLDLIGLWSSGDFTASKTGKNVVSSETLTVIVTPVTGWSEVINPDAGITGEDRETDTELIIRRKNELVKGKGTDSAIKNAMNNVDNVTAASVVSNRTAGEVDGIPAKSFETIVTGGIDDDIAQAIYDTMPSGIEPFGVGNSGTAINIEGDPVIIPFSRTTSTYIWVRYTRTQHPEEDYPGNGNSQVKQNLLEWAEDNIDTGIDVVRQRLETPFFEVPGSDSVITEFAETASPGGTPSYTTDSIIRVAARDIAQFADDRIFIILA